MDNANTNNTESSNTVTIQIDSEYVNLLTGLGNGSITDGVNKAVKSLITQATMFKKPEDVNYAIADRYEECFTAFAQLGESGVEATERIISASKQSLSEGDRYMFIKVGLDLIDRLAEAYNRCNKVLDDFHDFFDTLDCASKEESDEE